MREIVIIGGQYRPAWKSFSISGEVPVSHDDILRNINSARALGLGSPLPDAKPNLGPPLAVVGGGPSISKHIETLRRWTSDREWQGLPGEIWAINGAWEWCRRNGIEATFLAIDPHPIVMKWAAEKPAKAILASTCDPGVFDLLTNSDVKVIDLGGVRGDGNVKGGCSTATCAPNLAAKMGYSSVTLFGCESSYSIGQSHAYQHEARDDEMIVECGGWPYLVTPDLYMQAEHLSTMIREVPDYISEQSGGLLRAIIEHGEYHVAWVSEGMAKSLQPAGEPLVSIQPGVKEAAE